MVGSWIVHFRFDHPYLFRAICVLVLLLLLSFGFMHLPQSPFFRATGITSAQQRALAMYYAAYWEVKSKLDDDSPAIQQDTIYGSVNGIDKDGHLLVSVPDGKRFIKSSYCLADIKVTDIRAASALVEGMQTEDAKIVVYQDNLVVVWIRNAPLNVTLVESGFAMPDPNPPTNIVDRSFATYYWSKAGGRNG